MGCEESDVLHDISVRDKGIMGGPGGRVDRGGVSTEVAFGERMADRLKYLAESTSKPSKAFAASTAGGRTGQA